MFTRDFTVFRVWVTNLHISLKFERNRYSRLREIKYFIIAQQPIFYVYKTLNRDVLERQRPIHVYYIFTTKYYIFLLEECLIFTVMHAVTTTKQVFFVDVKERAGNGRTSINMWFKIFFTKLSSLSMFSPRAYWK